MLSTDERRNIQNIMDVFQIEGRGTFVTGYIGDAWTQAERGEAGKLYDVHLSWRKDVAPGIQDAQ